MDTSKGDVIIMEWHNLSIEEVWEEQDIQEEYPQYQILLEYYLSTNLTFS
ncbi:MAG: hypothetical protein ACOX5F_00680 [Anaerovoracaceae bacterium]